MTTRILAWITIAVTGIVLLCSGLVTTVLFGGGGGASASCIMPASAGPYPSAAVPSPLSSGGGPIGKWTSEQVANAATIVTVGMRMGVPPRGWAIAVATAMQESSLINTPGGDQDSIGLFQQRPSQGWGTPAQLHDPDYAAGKFYEKLQTIHGWQAMPLADAAQAVQRSAYPDAYAKWESDAIRLVQALTGASGQSPPPGLEQALSDPFCLPDGGDGQPGGDLMGLPPGFALPPATPPAVVTAIMWALAQLGTPYSFGGDCTAPHAGMPAHQCDCSSLVQQAYRAAGIGIPRTTGDQVHAGTSVPGLTHARPGDLLFIPGSDGSATSPGHVGMYLGQGLLVQAPHTGDVVKISKLASWANQVVVIRRIA